MRFTKTHEWGEVKEGVVVVGITFYAQAHLGDIVAIESPHVGTKFKQGESIGIVDSVKASSDIYAPVTGEVVAINEELKNNPQWMNQSPYDKGWIAKIKPSNTTEFEKLMSKEEYETYLKTLGS